MADQLDSTQQPPPNPRLARFLAVYQRIDRAVFTVEAAIVSAATALMTIFIFLDLTFTFANGIRVRLFTEAGRAGGLEQSRVIALVLVIVLALGLVRAGVRANPALRKAGVGGRLAAAGLITAIIGVLVVLLVTAHPRVTCLCLVVLGALYALSRIRHQARQGRSNPRIFVIWALSTALLAWFAATVPDRFSSWTQPYALFLLLWTGFIGASMATSHGRHLKIDAVRKTLPTRLLPRYNALSYLIAAAFTAVFCYLSVKYTLARFDNPHTAGEIPDWLKVLAIPVSLFFISLRFAARSLLASMGHVERPVDEVALAEAEVAE